MDACGVDVCEEWYVRDEVALGHWVRAVEQIEEVVETLSGEVKSEAT